MAAAAANHATNLRKTGIFWKNDVSDEDQPLAFVHGSNRGAPFVSAFRATTNRRGPGRSGQSSAKRALCKPRAVWRENLAGSESDALPVPAVAAFPPGAQTERDRIGLKHLCPEDKKRIANLIQELARVSEEKEETALRFRDEQGQFEQKILELEEQNILIAEERENLQQQYRECQELLGLYQLFLRQPQDSTVLPQSLRQPQDSAVLPQSLRQLQDSTVLPQSLRQLQDSTVLPQSLRQLQDSAVLPQSLRQLQDSAVLPQSLRQPQDSAVLPQSLRQPQERLDFHWTHQSQAPGAERAPHGTSSLFDGSYLGFVPPQQLRPQPPTAPPTQPSLQSGPCASCSAVHRSELRSPVPSSSTSAEQGKSSPAVRAEDWEQRRIQLLVQRKQLQQEREWLQRRLSDQEQRMSRQQGLHGNGCAQTELSSQTPAGAAETPGPTVDRELRHSEHSEATERLVPESRRSSKGTSTLPSPDVHQPNAATSPEPRPESRLDLSLSELLGIFSPVCPSTKQKSATYREKTAPRSSGPAPRSFKKPAPQDWEESRILEDIFFIC